MARFIIALGCFILSATAAHAQNTPDGQGAGRYTLSDNGQIVLDTYTGHIWVLDRSSLQTGKPSYTPGRYEEDRNPNSNIQVDSKTPRFSFRPTYGN